MVGHEPRLARSFLGVLEERDAEAQVEHARRDHLGQGDVVVALAQLDADVRPLAAVAAQDVREDARAGRLEGADADGAGLARDERVAGRPARPRRPREAIAVRREHLAGLGQRDRARPAGPLDEARADDALERRDLLRDRRLRVAEALSGTREGALLGDRLERSQMACLDADESITRHDRFQSLSVFPLLIAQADTTEGSQSVKELDMINVIFVLVAFVALPALAWRYGWSPRAQLLEPTERLARAGSAQLRSGQLAAATQTEQNASKSGSVNAGEPAVIEASRASGSNPMRSGAPAQFLIHPR